MAQLLAKPQGSAPNTARELAALTAKRDELRSQLEAVTEQRNQVAHDLERTGSDPAVRNAPLARLRAMDERIGNLEREINTSDALIAEAKAKGLATEQPAPAVVHIPDIPPIVGNLPGFGFATSQQPRSWRERMVDDLETTAPIALASVVLFGAVMYWWISRSVRGQLTRLVAVQSARLEELQRSMDTVAVEIERVSENQRYVTKLVGDKAPAERR